MTGDRFEIRPLSRTDYADWRPAGDRPPFDPAVYDPARAAGCSRVYWQTQVTNQAARALYDKLAEHRGFIVYAHELN